MSEGTRQQGKNRAATSAFVRVTRAPPSKRLVPILLENEEPLSAVADGSVSPTPGVPPTRAISFIRLHASACSYQHTRDDYIMKEE